MARKARQRISYVLPLPNANSPGGHRLGVNSLAVDSQRGILYSAGRDGAICSWNLGVDISGPAATSTPQPSTFRDQIQAHTHWVNDIALCRQDSALVSCSSDLTVKLWRPDSEVSQFAETIGVHSDYVKCLAATSDWVASGGLDRKIKFWDLNGAGEKLQIDVGDEGKNPKGSIYSLGYGGGILASGGPESVVRVWDPRSGKRVTKFVGHTDNVRSILISDDGNMLLTASSDTTIKLWSVATGRCMQTLSMHNDSVWSLHSSHPGLEVFHSSDRSGLVAKTDVRNVAEIEEGMCVAVCQEKEGANKVVASGGYVWAATSSSNVNRWMDIDTEAALESEYGRPRVASSASSRPRGISVGGTSSPPVTIVRGRRSPIPVNSLLRLSSTSSFATNVRDPDAVTVYSMASARQASLAEAMMDDSAGAVIPVNDLPDDTIEGQHGLIKHFLLNDRRSVLTVDTAGEVVLWDLIKCIPTKSFGKRPLDDVAAEINTVDSIANWCQVDTRTGRLACVLEENRCFDAEMYADEADLGEKLEFRDDQRINLGKWVLRYLFSNLIDQEIIRDEEYRKSIELERKQRESTLRSNAPAAITLPPPPLVLRDGSSVTTPLAKPSNGGYTLFPVTPGMQIGLATPAPFYSPHLSATASPVGDLNRLSIDRPGDRPSDGGGDYFTAGPKPTTEQSTDATTPLSPGADPEKSEGKDSSFFALGKWRTPFGSKKLGRSASTDMGGSKPTAPSAEDAANSVQAAAEEVPTLQQLDPIEDTLLGVIRRLRQSYETQQREADDDPPLTSAITPALPGEAPVLKPPPDTTIIVQEDKPDSGGVSDLYRGTVACVGEDADLLEKVAPAWLGDLLLLNTIPLKETQKISFVLVPWEDELPTLPSESGRLVLARIPSEDSLMIYVISEGKNSRLNANRMLRAKKIMAYVAERLAPPFMTHNHVPEGENVKPEDWLELICHGQVVPVTMTLSTMRSYIWKTAGDIVLYYRRKKDRNGESEATKAISEASSTKTTGPAKIEETAV